MSDKKSALIAGATGLVGRYLLEYLLKDDEYDQIIVLTRRKLPLSNRKVNQLVIDFDQMENELKNVQADDVYCALGTTMNKAGSKQSFYKVDHDYPYHLARIMLDHKAKKFLMVTSLGASSKSLIFYNRVKGEVEESVRSLGYPALFIFKPSLLLGDRPEKRLGEDIAKKTYKFLDKIFVGPFRKYRGIRAEKVAEAMIKMAHTNLTGTIILESDKIREA